MQNLNTQPESVLVTRDVQGSPVAVTFFKGKEHDIHLTERAGMDDISKLLNGRLQEEKV